MDVLATLQKKKSFYCLTLFISPDIFPHYEITSPHLTSPHLTSPHLTSPHLTSPHLTSPHLTSPHLTSPHLTSPHRFNGRFMRVAQLCFALLCLVVLLSPAQAGLIITIAPDGSGNARMLVTGSGSTTSTTSGSWDGINDGVGLFQTTNPFNSFFSGATARSIYFFQDFEIDGFQVSAGTQTRTLDRFTFDDDGNSGDDFSLGFGDGTNSRTWDTDGEGVGAISVLETAWQTIRFRGNILFANPAGGALSFTDNFNVGTYTFDSANNVFWGGSATNGITLVVSNAVIPEPTSALLLLLPATALLRRKRFC